LDKRRLMMEIKKKEEAEKAAVVAQEEVEKKMRLNISRKRMETRLRSQLLRYRQQQE